MHKYRTHNCSELTLKDVGKQVKLSGWVHRQRDHGGLLFIDLRDHYGITQTVIRTENQYFKEADSASYESVVTIEGKVVKRSDDTINDSMQTGDIEVAIDKLHIESKAGMLPVQVNNNKDFPEETRLRHRFIDLRREKIHNNIILRSKIISHIREQMTKQGFLEIQTPILTASSPEGARDFLVPSRLHPGKFYALPQAPQMFKQLLMIGGFDKYFQIAPCFRDEDARADRSPGEFYQLDFEMSYVTQEDVFSALEPVLRGVFEKFSSGKKVTKGDFPKITYHDAMLQYGCDKPDLRNPLLIFDVSSVFENSGFSIFSKAIANGSVVRGIQAKGAANKPRSFFDNMNNWARNEGAPGLGYIIFDESGEAKGPIAKLLDEARLSKIKELAKINNGDAIFFACDKLKSATKLAGDARIKLGQDLDLINKDSFEFCWIVDFPMFEYDEKSKKIDFSHNPFSMPQGGLDALCTKNPLDIKAYQYDIVCNGIELSSGAIRNHLLDVMYKAFEIAGYTKQEVDDSFSGMIKALQYGAPPHGGSAPGIDRIVMLLADEENLREVVAFPMNQKAEDLLMNAPNSVSDEQLNELHIKIKPAIEIK